MLKKKLVLSLITAGCLSFIPTIANAQVNGYLIKDKSTNVVYKYNLNDLEDSMLGDKAFLNEFQNKCKNDGLFAFCDDSKKVVAYADVIEDFLQNKDNFNLEKYIKNDKTPSIKVDKIEQVKVDEKTDNKPVIKPDTKPVQKEEAKQDTNKINIQKLKQQIKTPEDLEKFLNEDSRFNQLKTPVGTFRFTTEVHVNFDKDINSYPYDFGISTRWNDEKISVVNIAKHTICTKQQARNIDKLLQDYQTKIANLSMKLFPNKKIRGRFVSENKIEINKIDTHPSEIVFDYWTNYEDDGSFGYTQTDISKFHFEKFGNSFWFSYVPWGLYKD
ncbi:hypothetical protein ADU80_00385 (plasmid) [Clostridium botulinum]|uniref:Uncharacterized protein n=1 Tax=Clostridium botulinum TaxID=1491 RepID=A0A9Q1ZCK2_CLOBO|nr:hypothetical protein [Clostridium botulinum]AEB77349.1 hypothetical protein CbC4_4149 [Clostridium botulinum BKT015925]KEH96337.1 hypothetical protein Y848_13745 [Clostridium botulinum C/D str. Sp77]KLU74442.1 hypothetical protein CBC3_p0147 [Clostridium botulinum V891]KOA85012.1 hypothetical protein ADU74_10100 [Clostridium botulinum]KOA88264.1 hypothetical protein ADU80_00385 [Clostridium botulinum]